MNREIKFRAWDRVIHKMLFPPEEGYQINIPEGDYFDADVYWMQYTGLKDKNGKEIYEGDVIKSPWMERSLYYKIVFWNGTYQAEEINNPLPSSENDIQYLWNICQASEVIGNIYETPELLNNVLNDKPSVATDDASSNQS